jgi:hypothetical protein
MSNTVLALRLVRNASSSVKVISLGALKSTNTSKPKKACCSSCKSGKKCESEKNHHH